MIYVFLRAPGTSLASNVCSGGEGQRPAHDLEQKQATAFNFISKAFLLVADMAPCPGEQWSASAWGVFPQSPGALISSYPLCLVASERIKSFAQGNLGHSSPQQGQDPPASFLSLCQAPPPSRKYVTRGERASSPSRLCRRVCLGVPVCLPPLTQLCPRQD